MTGQMTRAEVGSLIRSQRAVNLALIQAVPKVEKGEMKLEELPKEVKSAIEKAAGQAKVGGISESSESGSTVYHAEFNEAGVHTELFVDKSGKLLARTDQSALFVAPLMSAEKVSLQSVPEAVRESIQQYAEGSQPVADLDKGTWNGQTAYKVTIQMDGAPRHLVISENGQLLGDEPGAAGAPAGSETSTENASQGQQSAQEKQSSEEKQSPQKLEGSQGEQTPPELKESSK
jgi:hypothetical protein